MRQEGPQRGKSGQSQGQGNCRAGARGHGGWPEAALGGGGCCPGWPASLVERSQAARSRGSLGSLQLEVRLQDEMVLPSRCYQPLVQLLCREVKLGTQVRGPWGKVGGSRDRGPALPVLNPSCRAAAWHWPVSRTLPRPPLPRCSEFLRVEGLGSCRVSQPCLPCRLLQGPGQLIPIIEETTSTDRRQEVATNLLKLFLGQGLAKDFLDLLFQLELGRTSEKGGPS